MSVMARLDSPSQRAGIAGISGIIAAQGAPPGVRTGKRTGITERDRSGGWLNDFPLDATTLPLGQPTPDAKPLVVLKRVLKALGADLTGPADPLGLPGGAALLWEERLRVRLRAKRLVLPTQVVHVLWTDRNLR